MELYSKSNFEISYHHENTTNDMIDSSTESITLTVCSLDPINIESECFNRQEKRYLDHGQGDCVIETNEVLQSLQCKALDPIIIPPSNFPQINLHQTFSISKKLIQQLDSSKESYTQTSKTTFDRNQIADNMITEKMKFTSSKLLKEKTDSDRHHLQQMLQNKSLSASGECSEESVYRNKLQMINISSSTQYPRYPRKVITPRKIAIRKSKTKILTSPEKRSERIGKEHNLMEIMSKSNNNTCDLCIEPVIEKLYNISWDVAVQGLHELLNIAPQLDWTYREREYSFICRKLIDFLRSPRSVICRVACQVCGELFRVIKSSRRPEYDELVDILLCKTADTNRFIQRDANIALDKMVTYISNFHSVRSITGRGPSHKNHMVRATSARLLNCICVIAGVDNILGANANHQTRKRILSSLSKYLVDKHQDARRFGEMLCNQLRKHPFFNEYFFRDMEINQKQEMKRIISSISNKEIDSK